MDSNREEKSDATPESETRIQEIAAELGITVSAETRTACLEIAADHEVSLDSIGLTHPDTPSTPTSRRSDDSFNALIHEYSTPRSGDDTGPLTDLNIAVKDNIAAVGLPMTCGSEAFDCTPSFDAVVVERLLAAGADLIGKTNMEPFALGPTGEFSDYGVVENPRYDGRIAGGSSSGSAAAVAGGLVDAAIGSDTGGSVRIPAACCGLVGLKPTHRLVPRYGFVDLGASLDCIGPLTHNVSTATRILAAIAGPDPRDPSAAHQTVDSQIPAIDGLMIGVPDSLVQPATDAVQAVFDNVVSDLRSTDRVTVTSIDLDLGAIEDAFFHLNVNELAWLFRQTGVFHGQGTGYNEEIRQAFESMRAARPELNHLARRVLPSAYLDAETNSQTYTAARREVQAFTQRVAACFNEVDVLLTPTLRTVPPRYDRSKGKAKALRELASNTMPFSMAGTPAVSLPIGDVNGLPVSAQVVTPQFRDTRALAVADHLEQITA